MKNNNQKNHEINSEVDYKEIKKLFQLKFKDRHKIKGVQFSYNKDDYTNIIIKRAKTPESMIQDYYHRELLKNYAKIKHKSYLRDKKDLEEKKLMLNNTKIYKNEMNFTNIQDIFAQFHRKSKNDPFSYNTKKRKEDIENINRGLKKNKINNTLKKLSLHSTKIKEKIDMGQKVEENFAGENELDKVIDLISEKQKKLSKKIRLKRTGPSKIYNANFSDSTKNLDSLNNSSFLPHKNLCYSILYKNNFNSNKSSVSGNPISLIKNNISKSNIHLLQTNEGSKSLSFIKNNISPSFSLRNNSNNKESFIFSNSNKNEMILNNFENSAKLQNSSQRSKINISKSFNNFNPLYNKKHEPTLSFRIVSTKVKNFPRYTFDIGNLVKDYKAIKRKTSKLTEEYRKKPFAKEKEMKKILQIKEEMLMFNLKQKFLSYNFRKEKTKEKNMRDLLELKLRNKIELVDHPIGQPDENPFA